VPLVVDEGGKRLAKRTDAVAIAKFRERGVDPREIVGWVARRSGIAVEGRATAREVAGVFEMGRVPRRVVVCGERELGEIGGAANGRARERE
jgi:glutamyl/glutaminyl-tRNA synthetase